MYLMCWYSKKKIDQKTAQHVLLVFSCAVSGYFPHEAVQKELLGMKLNHLKMKAPFANLVSINGLVFIYKLYCISQCKLIKTRVDIKLLMEQTH